MRYMGFEPGTAGYIATAPKKKKVSIEMFLLPFFKQLTST